MQGSSIISSLCIPDFDDWMQGYMSKKYDSSFKKLWFGNNIDLLDSLLAEIS